MRHDCLCNCFVQSLNTDIIIIIHYASIIIS